MKKILSALLTILFAVTLYGVAYGQATPGTTQRSNAGSSTPNVSNATGALPVADGGTGSTTGSAYNLYQYRVVTSSTHVSFGDSITCGVGAGNNPFCNTNGYAYLLAADEGATLTNYGVSGDLACDQVNNKIMKYANSSETKNPIFTYMIGTNDSNKNGIGPYEAVYKNCHQAALAWLAIPSNYKTFAQACSLTGAWTNDGGAWYSGVAAYTTAQNATASCSITTDGGPLYVWYQQLDNDSGLWTYAVDGGNAVTVATATSPPIGPTYNGGTSGVGLIRITGLAAGSHTVLFTKTSSGGTMVLGAVGTASPYAYWGSPQVFAAGVPYQENDNISSTTAAYNSDALADVNLLAGDGLPIRFVNIRNYLNSTTDMYNTEHPNTTGHQHLRDAFASVEQFVPNGGSGSSLFSLTGNNAVYTGGSGAIVQNPASAAGVGNYLGTNGSSAGGATLSTTDLNAGELVYTYLGGAFSFGIDLGYDAGKPVFPGSGGYQTRLFAPNPASIALSFTTPAQPTAQSDFTESFIAYSPVNLSGGYGKTQILLPSNTAETGQELSNTSPGGRNYDLYSTGTGDTALGAGYFAIADATANAIRFSINSSGNTGIGAAAATDKLDVAGAVGLTTITPTLPTNGVYLSASDTLDLTTAGAKAFELSATKHAAWQGSAPTLSSCGAGPRIDANATDSSGQVTEGNGTATSCTITFANAYSSYVHCRVTPETAGVAGFGYSYTTSAITVTGASLTSAVFDYACDGK